MELIVLSGLGAILLLTVVVRLDINEREKRESERESDYKLGDSLLPRPLVVACPIHIVFGDVNKVFTLRQTTSGQWKIDVYPEAGVLKAQISALSVKSEEAGEVDVRPAQIATSKRPAVVPAGSTRTVYLHMKFTVAPGSKTKIEWQYFISDRSTDKSTNHVEEVQQSETFVHERRFTEPPSLSPLNVEQEVIDQANQWILEATRART